MASLMKFILNENVLEFEEGASYPARRPLEKMQVQDRTAAYTLQVEDLGYDNRKRVLNFIDMLKTDHDNLYIWYHYVVNGIEKTFTFIDERGYEGIVRFVDTKFDFSEDNFELFSGTLTVEYQS